jgi:hypothetical protein
VHTVVPHPETVRTALYVYAAFTQHIVGVDKNESDSALSCLYAQAAIPEYPRRFRWRARTMRSGITAPASRTPPANTGPRWGGWSGTIVGDLPV